MSRNNLVWGIMAVSAISVAGYALVNIFLPIFRSEFVQNLFSESPVFSLIHLFFGAIAISLGAFQFNKKFRNKFTDIHRALGFLYIFSVVFGGASGFVLAIGSVGSFAAKSGFALMAFVWVAVSLNAYKHIFRGNVNLHQKWMIRSYAVTMAGVTLRIYLGLSVLIDLNFNHVYPVLAWMCWVPNLIVVELYFWLKGRRLAEQLEPVEKVGGYQ